MKNSVKTKEESKKNTEELKIQINDENFIEKIEASLK